MNIETEQVEQPATSPEDKFFGVSVTVDTADDDNLPVVELTAPDQEPPKKDSMPTKEPDPKPKTDKDEDELAEYSENVKKRIGTLTHNWREAERQQKIATDQRNEAISFARQATQRSQHFENIVTTGEANLVEQIKGRAANFVELAKSEYQKAYEEGDSAAIIKAQEKFIQSQAEQREAFQYEQDYQYRSDQQRQQYGQQQQQQAYQQQMARQAAAQAAQQPVPVKPTEIANQWSEENPWFHDKKHPDMTALAYGVHERLVGEGVAPDSKEYFDGIDHDMRQRFPDYTGFKQADPDPPHTVVASAERSGGKPPRKVKLTSTAVDVAKQLGLTVEQYAHQMMKPKGTGI